MFFRKRAKSPPPVVAQELIDKRNKTLIDLESDLHAAGWDKNPKYYHILDYEGDNVVVLRDEVPEKPISYLVGRTYALGVDSSVIGCVMTFEGWALPDGVVPEPGVEYPDKRETRVVTAEFCDGMSGAVQRFKDTDEVRVVNSATHEAVYTSRGALIDAMQFSIGRTAEPTDECRQAVESEMHSFFREHLEGERGLLADDRYKALYSELSELINNNADNQRLEACIRGHAKSLDLGEDELIALAKFTGLI